MGTPGTAPPSPGGTRFGKYQLIKKLASGGMGEVFLAEQVGPVGFKKILVIKRILAKHLDKQAYVDMFFSEARVAALLNHGNIVQIYDMGEEQEHFFIAMEYVNGRSLREIIDVANKTQRPVPLQHILDITAQVCAGMSYAHNMVDPNGQPLNLVHRDINPQNLLISYHGEAKVIDFGIAKSSVNTHKTEAGTIKGKYVYMSPEQSAAEPLDKRSDLFALGIVMYEICAGVNPFHQNTIVASLEAIQRKEPPPLELKRPDVVQFIPIIQKALAKERDDRYSDASEIRQDVLELIQSGRIERTKETLAEYMAAVFQDHGEISSPTLRTPSSTSGSGQARSRANPSNPASKPVKTGSQAAASPRPKTPPPAPPPPRTPPPGTRPGATPGVPPTRILHTPPPTPKPALPSAGGHHHQVVPVAPAPADSAAELFPDADPTELEVEPSAARFAASKPAPRKKLRVNPSVVWAVAGVLAAVVVLLAAGIVARLLGYWPRPPAEQPVRVSVARLDAPAAQPPQAAPPGVTAPATTTAQPAAAPVTTPAPVPANATPQPATAAAPVVKPIGTLTIKADDGASITMGSNAGSGTVEWSVQESPGEALVRSAGGMEVRVRFVLKDGRIRWTVTSTPVADIQVNGAPGGKTPLENMVSADNSVVLVLKSTGGGKAFNLALGFRVAP